MVPIIYYRGNISFVYDPAILGERPSDLNRDFVVVSVWTATFPVVVENTMLGADSDRFVFSHEQCLLTGIIEIGNGFCSAFSQYSGNIIDGISSSTSNHVKIIL